MFTLMVHFDRQRSQQHALAEARRDGLELEVIEHPEELAALEPGWDDLVRRASGTPFMLNAYLTAVWRESQAAGSCIVARRGEQLVGGLPLLVRRHLGTRRASLLSGAHRSDLLCDPQEPGSTGKALLGAVWSLPVDWLAVHGVLPDSGLAHALPRAALRPQQQHVHWLEMPDGWEAAYQTLVSSKGRSDDRRKLRRLGELGELGFRIATSGEELQRALGYAFEIYRHRWQDRAAEAGGFASHESSWRSVGRAMGDRGHAQLVTLHLDGTPIAFTYSFLLGGTMWGHRLAFDSDLTQYSPGWLTIQHAIRAASAAGMTRVDFGLGNEAYKQRLATGRSQLLWGTAMASGLTGAIAAHVEEAGFAARQEAKQRPAIVQGRQRAFRLRHLVSDRWRSRSAPAPL